ncbi:peptidase C15, pyroglutamyl peptidase I-like protein [Dothidotthia symphoricarpi CBS 119687]|uniref:Peptidase C15, pyroglutamyl peptidase I-like protein n=1 Tax=Dothidotthia symphoricarpi CBS 119687 TaxID=1392245 RepID=A0A6A6AFX7_9PLEO|nr:peptidase C15, pyroglutamyl peptidase I-like protein [Dothidotthia symphoricarpi CBS 119687]KAF2130015.1 peptidase C15, pyroglutamyl peptidase I-like protein [Dothidotthia symphoricarpi CBS 119687]
MPPRQVTKLPPAEEGEKPVTVLVTGFGPFLSSHAKNSSWEIASKLPAIIPASSSNKTPIHICVHHEPIRVSFAHVLNLRPKILPPSAPLRPAPDIVLHIGLAAGRKYFGLEKQSHSKGYGSIPDVDGKKFLDESAEDLHPSSQFPATLTTSFDTDDVLKRWKAHIKYAAEDAAEPDTRGFPDVRVSYDAGNFLCGFIYYSSLAHYFEIKQDERPVVFLHVPDLSGSQDRLKEGWENVIALIKALVESRREVGVVDGARSFNGEEDGGEKVVTARTDNNFA